MCRTTYSEKPTLPNDVILSASEEDGRISADPKQ
jgi:hypothetical protein